MRTVEVRLSYLEWLVWPFVVAEVRCPILGIDFLAAHDLGLELRRRQLIHRPSGTTIPTKRCRRTHPAITHVSQATSFNALLKQYPRLIDASTTSTVDDPGVFHTIITSSLPCYAKPSRMPPERLKATKKEFDTMVAQGIARPSDSPWSSPLHMVPKQQEGE